MLYYITDRRQLSQNDDDSLRLVLDCIRQAAEAKIDFIQLRERDLPARELCELALVAAKIIEKANFSREFQTKFLINSRTDIALVCGVAGVHLRSKDISASDARAVMMAAGRSKPMVAVSCHSLREVELAEGHGADFAVFGPVFGKFGSDSPALGLSAVRQIRQDRRAANPRMPVLALGGVDVSNAAECLEAGADGIAGIRLFQREDVGEIMKKLRGISGLRPNNLDDRRITPT